MARSVDEVMAFPFTIAEVGQVCHRRCSSATIYANRQAPPNLFGRAAAVRAPCVDGSKLARRIFTSQAWSVQPCVRPLSAVHMTAGHHALADQVPVTNPHSRMQWPKWVVLIAGSTGSALRAVRPPNLHITPWCSARSRQTLSEAGIYRSPLAIIAQAIRASLLASAMAATLVGRRASNAATQGRYLVPWILA